MKNLKILRKNNGLTLNELSKKTGLSIQLLSYYELGKANPPIETLYLLADYFGCSVDYLIGHETKSIIYADSFSPIQQKLITLIRQLSPDQSLQLVGYCSSMLGLPFEDVKPKRPW